VLGGAVEQAATATAVKTLTDETETSDSQGAVSDLSPPASTHWELPDTNDLS